MKNKNGVNALGLMKTEVVLKYRPDFVLNTALPSLMKTEVVLKYSKSIVIRIEF